VEEDSDEIWGINASDPWLSGDPADYLLPPTQSATAKTAKIRGKKFSPQDFLEGHHLYSDATTSAFEGEKLLYVTPWNQKGYGMATLLRRKLTWLAPVWFQIRKDPLAAAAEGGAEGEGGLGEDGKQKARVKVDGEEGADLPWLRAVGSASQAGDVDAEDAAPCREPPRVLLVPRVSLECELGTLEEMEQAAAGLVALLGRLEAQDAKVDGFTLEIPFAQLDAALFIPGYLRELRPDIKLIMVLPAVKILPADTDEGKQHRQVLDLLAQSVDRLSVTTYDRAMDGSPHAPYHWVKEVMLSLRSVQSLQSKLLMGLPFYGWRDGEDMTAERMVQWLATDDSVKVTWDIVAQEHTWSDSRGKSASYPTPHMIQRRLELARELGLQGVAIWEGGQGLAAAVDLL